MLSMRPRKGAVDVSTQALTMREMMMCRQADRVVRSKYSTVARSRGYRRWSHSMPPIDQGEVESSGDLIALLAKRLLLGRSLLQPELGRSL